MVSLQPPGDFLAIVVLLYRYCRATSVHPPRVPRRLARRRCRPPPQSLWTQGRPGSSAPGRGEQDPATRGRGAARDAMAGVSPYVEGTRILRTLGAGSYGRVVLARYPDTRVDVALKIADRRGGTSRKRILWKAACLRDAAHAHVIRLLDVCASTPGGEQDPRDLPTLAFPPADVDLATFLDRRPRGVLPTALARRLMGQLASALAPVLTYFCSPVPSYPTCPRALVPSHPRAFFTYARPYTHTPYPRTF